MHEVKMKNINELEFAVFCMEYIAERHSLLAMPSFAVMNLFIKFDMVNSVTLHKERGADF